MAEAAPAGETPPDSSASSEGEAAALASGAAEASAAARGVFADAGEEFASLGAVKGRLEGWKRAHPSAYAAAYAPLSVPALLAPFVRLELLTAWQPLRPPPSAASAAQGAGFDHLDFFAQLFDYGMPLSSPDDADAELLPALRLPDGGRALRRFPLAAPVATLRSWAASASPPAAAGRPFRLAAPGTALPADEEATSIEAAGLAGAMLAMTWAD